jgi:hypothetical protein
LEEIRENIMITTKYGLGYKELKEHEPCSEQKCSKLLDVEKQNKLQWL